MYGGLEWTKIGTILTKDEELFTPMETWFKERKNEYLIEGIENQDIDEGLDEGLDESELLGDNLLPVNIDFEICINNLLDDNTPKADKQMMDSIYKKKSIYKLTKSEISYIKRKLDMLFVDDVEEDIIKCIDTYILIDTDICSAGLTEQMNIILMVLFSVIGIHFNLDQLNNNNSRKHKTKLMYIINQLGDIIPKALKRIVDISKKLEIKKCNNEVSNNTLVLENLYNHLFTPQNNMFSFDMGITKLISDASPIQFERVTILMVLGVAFLKYF